MFICAGNVIVRKAVAEDAPLMGKWWRDGRIMAHAGFPMGRSITNQEMAEKIARFSDEQGRIFIIEIDGQPVGEVSYWNIGNRAAAIGINICCPVKQGNGYGTKILKLFIQKLFRLGFTKILLDTRRFNTRAQHVYEKVGFTRLQPKSGWRARNNYYYKLTNMH